LSKSTGCPHQIRSNNFFTAIDHALHHGGYLWSSVSHSRGCSRDLSFLWPTQTFYLQHTSSHLDKKKGQNTLAAPYLESAAPCPPGIEGSAAALQHRRCLSPSMLTDLCPFQFFFVVLVFFPVGCTITWCDKV
jgi:hypothetical protein